MQPLIALLPLLAPQEPSFPVFLLAGQSNMEGQAVVDLDHEEYYNSGKGNLERLYEDPKLAGRLAHLRDEGGEWIVRDDVLVWYRRGHEEKLKAGELTIGYAVYEDPHHFGPELQFGHVVGEHFDEPVLLVKACWGGKSLYKDFRPPSAEGETGPYYTKMLEEYHTAIEDAVERLPQLKGLTPRLEGLVWFQGWNDMVSDEGTQTYAANLTHLIQDVRRDLASPNLPVVVGETGNAASEEFRGAQREGTTHPDFEGNVAFVPTRQFLRPAEESPNTGHGHHWFGHAESYFLIGDAFGHALLKLLKE